MYEKPRGFNRVGIVQCFLAAFFVLWFLILPEKGRFFAWPVVPELTAAFLGAGFILRSYFGYHLWRDKYWYTVRWSMFGDYAFLAVLFVTTWWHIGEMNWHLSGAGAGLRDFSLVIVHVWVLAYTFEPLTVFLLHPRTAEADAPVPADLSQGELLQPLKSALVAMFYLGTAIWALLFFSPDFANTRWPWPLNPFDARIMSAWFAGVAVWSITMYFMKDWAEVKMGVRAILLFLLAELGVWVLDFSRYPLNPTAIAARQALIYGLTLAAVSAWLLFAYGRQERARKRIATSVLASTSH
ncbi:MAG: hypothetical protein ACM3XO_28905 [Bacteroidota bacterium]